MGGRFEGGAARFLSPCPPSSRWPLYGLVSVAAPVPAFTGVSPEALVRPPRHERTAWLSQIPLSCGPKGPYGIRTRAAAVRGRCPRPLDEWAVAKAECSGRCLGERPRRRTSGGTIRRWRAARGEGRIGLAGVDPLLEAPTDLLAGREQVVARAARRELHHAHRFVAVTMAARIGGCLVERPEAVRLPPEGHVVLLPAIARRGNPTYPSGTALCARFVQAVQYQGLQDHGLQSRPERTKYR